jgi:hypothetical protein
MHWIAGWVGPSVALDALAPPTIELRPYLHFKIIAAHSSSAPLYHIHHISAYECSAGSHTTIIIFSFLNVLLIIPMLPSLVRVECEKEVSITIGKEVIYQCSIDCRYYSD